MSLVMKWAFLTLISAVTAPSEHRLCLHDTANCRTALNEMGYSVGPSPLPLVTGSRPEEAPPNHH
jgi:hypothetical protein